MEETELRLAVAIRLFQRLCPWIDGAMDERRAYLDLAQRCIDKDPTIQVEDRDWLLSKARSGSWAAHNALCDLAEDLISRGEGLPDWLALYVISSARVGADAADAKMKSRTNDVILVRDQDIVVVMQLVIKAFGLSATRNPATAEKGVASCASIISQALARVGVELSEYSINKIWRDRNKRKGRTPFGVLGFQ